MPQLLETDQDKNAVYFILPAEANGGSEQIIDSTSVDEGFFQEVRRYFSSRKAVKVDEAVVAAQIRNYISIVKNVAASNDEADGKFRLAELELSLTVSASGNLGIASTSAEAAIKLIFKRG